MGERDILIICRNRKPAADAPKNTLNGLLEWGSHLKQKYLVKHVDEQSSAEQIRARIEANIAMPEWIGNHRFGIYDLLNYVINKNNYVYKPEVNEKFFDPVAIPSVTSVHLYYFLKKKGYNPVNIDNIFDAEDRLRECLKTGPGAVLISATFLSAASIKSIVRGIRNMNTTVPIIIGSGVLLSKLDGNARLSESYGRIVDKGIYVILDDCGLESLFLLLKALKETGNLAELPNLVYGEAGNLKYTNRREEGSFDDTFPDWTVLGSSITKNVGFVRSSQGCPFKCKFCTFSKATINFKMRSVESIRAELRLIKAAGIRNIAFTDDHFAINPKRVREVCGMMIKEKFDFNWFAGIRAGAIDEDNAKLLEDSGCRVLCVGLESGDDRMLKLINKQTDTLTNMKALKILDKHNIVAYGSFLLGFPGETQESINNTINWINSSPLKLYKVFLFYLMAGSIIYDEMEDHGVSFLKDKHDSCMWKTPSLDALVTSELLKGFISKIERAVLIYNYSPMYAFFPLLTKGFTMDECIAMFRIRTDLVKREISRTSFYADMQYRTEKLNELRNILSKKCSLG